MRRLLCLLACATIVGCGGDPEAPKPDDGRPPQAIVLAHNLDLFPGEGRAVRLGFQPFVPTANVRIEFRPPRARVSVCPLTEIDGAIDRARCRNDIGSGVREPITTDGLRALAIVLDGNDPASANVRVEYDEAGRDIAVRLPLIPRPAGETVCRDNGCNPFFEVLPVRKGAFSARATWTGPEASLVLLQGSVIGRSLTATGVPYVDAVRADGATPLQIQTKLSTPAEYALVIRQRAGARAGPITDIAIDATWP